MSVDSELIIVVRMGLSLLLSVRSTLAPAGFLVVRGLHTDPNRSPLLALVRRLVVEAEPGDGLQLGAGNRGRALAVAEPPGLLPLSRPGAPHHPPVALEVCGRSGNLHTGGLPTW